MRPHYEIPKMRCGIDWDPEKTIAQWAMGFEIL